MINNFNISEKHRNDIEFSEITDYESTYVVKRKELTQRICFSVLTSLLLLFVFAWKTLLLLFPLYFTISSIIRYSGVVVYWALFFILWCFVKPFRHLFEHKLIKNSYLAKKNYERPDYIGYLNYAFRIITLLIVMILNIMLMSDGISSNTFQLNEFDTPFPLYSQLFQNGSTPNYEIVTYSESFLAHVVIKVTQKYYQREDDDNNPYSYGVQYYEMKSEKLAIKYENELLSLTGLPSMLHNYSEIVRLYIDGFDTVAYYSELDNDGHIINEIVVFREKNIIIRIEYIGEMNLRDVLNSG
ncbi:MAG: hypothetical protein FWG88_07875 [Oscillospiraceae bacterium]|nr:hypothetical protein [Oscillospiraceae bacterium]